MLETYAKENNFVNEAQNNVLLMNVLYKSKRKATMKATVGKITELGSVPLKAIVQMFIVVDALRFI